MRNRGQLYLGGSLVLFGLLILIANLLDINIWAVCGPTALILFGVWLIARPVLNVPGSGVNLNLFANINRVGEWQLKDEEIWMFVGDIRLDLTRAQIPLGETTLRVLGFVGDVDLLIPQGAGFSLQAMAIVNDAKIEGQKNYVRVLSPYQYTSDNYQAVEQKIRIETTFFVGDLTVNQL
jgi:hypothetical protein